MELEVGKRYEHGRGVAVYLARYIRSGAIRNRQIVSSGERGVTFRYKDRKTNRIRTMTLSTQTFLSRLFEHIPLPGYKVARAYGLYHHHHRESLERCRELLPEPPDWDPQPEATDEEADEALAPSPPSVCEVCEQPLYEVEIPPGGIPPALLSVERVGCEARVVPKSVLLGEILSGIVPPGPILGQLEGSHGSPVRLDPTLTQHRSALAHLVASP